MIVTAMNCPQCEGEGAVGGVECPACAGTGEVEQAVEHPAGTELEEALAAAAPPAVTNALQRPEDPVSRALAEVTAKTSTILALADKGRELAARYKDVAFNVRTVKGLDEAKAARQALREEVRYPMQKLRDERSKMLGTMQRQANASADALIEEVEGYERPIHEQIHAEEQRKESERREREEAEQRRRQGHLDAIAAIYQMVTDASGFDSKELLGVISAAQEILVDEGYEEFQGQAQQAKDEALRQLQGLLVAALAEEAELEEIRRQQAALAEAQQKLEADRRAQAERDRHLAEREKVLAENEARQKAEAESLARAKQERAEAVGRRVEELRSIATGDTAAPATSVELQTQIESLEAVDITVELFDDRAGEADRHRRVAIGNLRELLSAALEREAEEARQAHAARIQELIANIRGMGESATLAVQDGSAEVQQLRAGLQELRDTQVSSDLFGERADEATALLREAVQRTEQAIAATVERDRLRAEEAERQRAQQQEQLAALALIDAKRSRGEELYEMVRRFILGTNEDWVLDSAVDKAGRALLLAINPAEDFED